MAAAKQLNGENEIMAYRHQWQWQWQYQPASVSTGGEIMANEKRRSQRMKAKSAMAIA
jgi:heme/copper-type cytochrome/quinol oxidase subunit 2